MADLLPDRSASGDECFLPLETPQAAVRAAIAPIRSELQAPPRFTEIAQQAILERYRAACVVINRKTRDPLHMRSDPGLRQTAQRCDADRSAFLGARIDALAASGGADEGPGVGQAGGSAQSSYSAWARPARGGHHDRAVALAPAGGGIDPRHFQLPKRDEAAAPASQVKAAEASQTTDDALVHQLEDELQTTRDDLKGTIDQLEAANEELKASNEEATSVNEELQSSNEELETSKEELQSLNEELSTVNSQLQIKVDELEAKNNDVSNLLSSTDIATLFLDRQFRVKWFTSSTTRLLRLIPTDIGRPIGDFAQKFTGEDIISDAEKVLHSLAPIEREVFGQDGHWYLRRIVPYRTADNRIDGVVIAFVDIHESKKAQEGLRQLAAVVRDSNDAVILSDLEGIYSRLESRRAERCTARNQGEALGRKITEFIPARLGGGEMQQFVRRLLGGHAIAAIETPQRQTRERKDPGCIR